MMIVGVLALLVLFCLIHSVCFVILYNVSILIKFMTRPLWGKPLQEYIYLSIYLILKPVLT